MFCHVIAPCQVRIPSKVTCFFRFKRFSRFEQNERIWILVLLTYVCESYQVESSNIFILIVEAKILKFVSQITQTRSSPFSPLLHVSKVINGTSLCLIEFSFVIYMNIFSWRLRICVRNFNFRFWFSKHFIGDVKTSKCILQITQTRVSGVIYVTEKCACYLR